MEDFRGTYGEYILRKVQVALLLQDDRSFSQLNSLMPHTLDWVIPCPDFVLASIGNPEADLTIVYLSIHPSKIGSRQS